MIDKGPYTKNQLAERGVDEKELRRLMSLGRLRRVARGWYAESGSPKGAVRAVQMGCRLGCLSACAEYGLWVPPHRELHVVTNPGVRLPNPRPTDVQFHRISVPCVRAVSSLEDSVAQVLHRHDEETGLVVLESAVNRGLLGEHYARYLLKSVPMRGLRSEQHFSPLAQSGSETRLRLFFQRKQVPVEPQAVISGVGHVDLLVGKSWIIEADSQQFHSSYRQVATDCERDMAVQRQGYSRVRLSYEQIWVSWQHTQEWLKTLLRTRRHLSRPVAI